MSPRNLARLQIDNREIEHFGINLDTVQHTSVDTHKVGPETSARIGRILVAEHHKAHVVMFAHGKHILGFLYRTEISATVLTASFDVPIYVSVVYWFIKNSHAVTMFVTDGLRSPFPVAIMENATIMLLPCL